MTFEELKKHAAENGTQAGVLVSSLAAAMVERGDSDERLLNLVETAKEQGSQGGALLIELLDVMYDLGYDKDILDELWDAYVQQGNQSGPLVEPTTEIAEEGGSLATYALSNEQMEFFRMRPAVNPYTTLSGEAAMGRVLFLTDKNTLIDESLIRVFVNGEEVPKWQEGMPSTQMSYLINNLASYSFAQVAQIYDGNMGTINDFFTEKEQEKADFLVADPLRIYRYGNTPDKVIQVAYGNAYSSAELPVSQ